MFLVRVGNKNVFGANVIRLNVVHPIQTEVVLLFFVAGELKLFLTFPSSVESSILTLIEPQSGAKILERAIHVLPDYHQSGIRGMATGTIDKRCSFGIY